MKYIKIMRTLVVALTIALLAATIPATPALAAELRVEPVKGEIGDRIEIYGSGFGTGTQYEFYFSNEVASVGDDIDTDVQNYEYLGLGTADASGAFLGVYFDVPSRLRHGDEIVDVRGGTYYVYATIRLSKDIKARVSFTVESTAEITLNLTEGTVGTEVRVSGTDFAASKSVVINFDGAGVGTSQTDSAGSFSNAAFTVPAGYRGSHTVQARDESNNSDTATFIIQPSAAITPASGPIGDTLTISGTGFAASRSVTISFNSVVISTSQTSSIGSFTATFNVPALSAGNYNVLVLDSNGNSATLAFSIAQAAISLSPATGYSRTTVSVSGTGFQVNKPTIPILFNGGLVSTVATDAQGVLTGSFDVPVVTAGTYQVQVSDGINTVAADFIVLTTASISPITSAASPGHVGTELTISGIGFMAGRMVTITYDASQVATTTVSTDGTFSATFPAPASKGGQHTITAAGLTTPLQFTFFMESQPPPTPVPLKPEMGIKAEKETYFDWEDVTDPSGVTYMLQIATTENFSSDSIVMDITGLTGSEYTITKEERLKSVSKKTPYYWHVKTIDGASNGSQWSGTGEFYVGGFSLALSQPVIYTLIGIGALILILFAFWVGRRTAMY